jgi:hypothetical protein
VTGLACQRRGIPDASPCAIPHGSPAVAHVRPEHGVMPTVMGAWARKAWVVNSGGATPSSLYVGSLPRNSPRSSPLMRSVACRSSRRARIVFGSCARPVAFRDPMVTRPCFYARFIGGSVDYVLNQLVEAAVVKDRDSYRVGRRAPTRNRGPDAPSALGRHRGLRRHAYQTRRSPKP